MDSIVHGVTKSRKQPSDFHFHFLSVEIRTGVRLCAGRSTRPAQQSQCPRKRGEAQHHRGPGSTGPGSWAAEPGKGSV